MPLSLSKLFEYQNQKVLNRYTRDYPNNTLDSKKAFTELMKYFWLCQEHKTDLVNFPQNKELHFICVMHWEMTEIDDMWHTFLLFTKDYTTFCNQFFGEYIHHSPANDDEEFQREKFEIEFTRYLSYIYDKLGEETVNLWFGPLLN